MSTGSTPSKRASAALPSEFSDPALQQLMSAGSVRALTGDEVRAAFESTGLTAARQKAVLRALESAGVEVQVTAAPPKRAVAATPTRATTTARATKPAAKPAAKSAAAKSAPAAKSGSPAASKTAAATKTAASQGRPGGQGREQRGRHEEDRREGGEGDVERHRYRRGRGRRPRADDARRQEGDRRRPPPPRRPQARPRRKAPTAR